MSAIIIPALEAPALPTYPENDLCEFCGIRPWTTLIAENETCYYCNGAGFDGRDRQGNLHRCAVCNGCGSIPGAPVHACGVCAATCPECGVVYEHAVTCSQLEREPEAADRPLRDWDQVFKDVRL